MWQRLVQLHRQLEDDMLGWLAAPPPPESEPSRFKRRFICSIAEMNEIERREMREFMLKHRGWPGWRRFAVQPMLVLSVLGLNLHFWLPTKFSILEGILICNALGLSFGFALMGAWFNYRKVGQQSWSNILKFVVLATGGAFIGAASMALLDGRSVLALMERIGRWVLIAGVGMGLLHALILGVIGRLRANAFERENARLQAEAERERLARQLSESQLRLLEAQIEPHFLFNTLGAVQQLAEQGAPRAAALTASLIQFLRGSLTQMRNETVSLAEDFRRAEAYLQVMQVRMGSRLSFNLTLPPALSAQTAPTMMLLTLVENAIKHGIEPAVRGGHIEVTASQTARDICISVRDSGMGLQEGGVAGVGLSNVRERLKLIYGDAAHLTLQGVDEGGCLAAIYLPLSIKTAEEQQ
ncbi:sensor histidine kinase [Chitinimonas naiadis]